LKENNTFILRSTYNINSNTKNGKPEDIKKDILLSKKGKSWNLAETAMLYQISNPVIDFLINYRFFCFLKLYFHSLFNIF
jgi:hypothetical protein